MCVVIWHQTKKERKKRDDGDEWLCGMSSVSVCDLAGCGCVARGVLVRLNGVCVLVDCARCADALLPGGVVPHALPDALLSAEPALDAVLVTDVCGCDLLPLLFRAASVRRGHSLEALCVPRVYATEPVAFVARRVLRDFVQQTAERAGSEGGADEGDVERVADAIVEVHYDEDVVLVDGAVRATALPSGAELGGCCWRLTSAASGSTVVVLGRVAERSSDGGAAEGAASFVPWRDDALHGAVCVVVAEAPPVAVAVATEQRHHRYSQALRSAVQAVTGAVGEGRSVLVPCDMGGVALDLLDALAEASLLATLTAPVFVVAPAAHDLLQYAGVCGEWLRPALAARVLEPGDAYRHRAMAASGALHVYGRASGNSDGAADSFAAVYSEPCVVLASHPSCTRGDSALLLGRFGRTAQAVALLVDSRFPPAFVAAAHQHQHEALRCGVCFVPLDTALAATDAELAHTVAQHAPHAAAVVARRAVADALAAAGVPEHALVRLPDSGGWCGVPLPTAGAGAGVQCHIEHELASKRVAMRRVGAGLEHTTLVGVLPPGTVALLQPDSTYRITSTPQTSASPETEEERVFGDVAVARLVAALAQRGVQTAQVHSDAAAGTAVLRVVAQGLSDHHSREEGRHGDVDGGGGGEEGADTAEQSATVVVDSRACTVDVVSDSRALVHLIRSAVAAHCLHALTAAPPPPVLL